MQPQTQSNIWGKENFSLLTLSKHHKTIILKKMWSAKKWTCPPAPPLMGPMYERVQTLPAVKVWLVCFDLSHSGFLDPSIKYSFILYACQYYSMHLLLANQNRVFCDNVYYGFNLHIYVILLMGPRKKDEEKTNRIQRKMSNKIHQS